MSAKIEKGLTYTLLGATVLIRTINGQRVLPLEDIDFLFDKPAGSTQEVIVRKRSSLKRIISSGDSGPC